MEPTLASPAPRVKSPAKRVIPPQPLLSAAVVAGFVALLFAVEGLDTALGGALDSDGIVPRDFTEWDNVIWYPLLHFGWDHLIANSVPLLVLGFLATSGGLKQFFQVTVVVWLTGGLGTWLFGSWGVHLGASGLVFGYLTFLLVRGLFARATGQIAVALVVFAIYGAMLWGVLPGQPGISWEGHLFGALGGVLAAWGVARDNARAVAA